MKAFREERNTMLHTKPAVRWLSSVAALAAATLGASVTLAAPASAAAEGISASAAQPRYPIAGTAVFNVSIVNPNAGDALTLSVVSGPDHVAPTASCTSVSAGGTATCQLTNTGGAGTDQVVVSDNGLSVSSTPTPVSFETISATADQSVNLTSGGTAYLYGAGNTATVNATFTGASTTPLLKGLVTSGPDHGALLDCAQSVSQPANWACTLTNGGSGGADLIQLFDDDSANGTVNQADTDEAKTSLTVNFEKVAASSTPPRSQAAPGTPGTINVGVTGIPTGWTPKIKEQFVSGVDSSAGTCSQGVDPSVWTCSVINDGRSDAATVKVYDDLNTDGSPQASEPSSTQTVYFEKVSASLDQASHQSTGATVTITATADGVPSGQNANLDYVVSGEGDPDAGGVHNCSVGNPATCTLTNTGGPGTDTVTVFDDTNSNGAFDPREPSATVTVTFGPSVVATPRATIYPTKDANNPGSGDAAIDVAITTAGSQTSAVRYVVTSSTAGDNNAAGACQAVSGSTTNWVCDVLNGGGAGTDAVEIYNDTNGSGTVDGTEGDTAATVNVSFARPTSVTLTPKLAPGQSAAQVATGGCQIYTVKVSPAVQYPVRVTAVQDLGKLSSAPAATLSSCSVPGGSPVTFGGPGVKAGSGGIPILQNPDYTDTATFSGATNQDPTHPGEFIFGISSSKAGSITLTTTTTLATGPQVTAPAQTLTVVAPGAPHAVSVTPTTPTISQGGTQTFTALVQDASGTPVPGAKVSYVVAAGDPDATSSAVACQAGDQFGQSKCSIINNGKTGTDHVTFFSPLASNETAPASNDPQTTTTLTVQAAPPAGSTLSFGCPDELVTDANQIVPACTVTTGNGGAQQVIFAAHVAGPNSAPLAGIPVTFAMTTSPNGTTSTATSVATNAKGNALFVVSVPAPVAGNKVTVTATVGNPSSGGLGPKAATATFQSPHPASVKLTPASQHVATGGQVTVTVRVADQFGVGVAGQSISYSVAGRNNHNGSLTTGSAGTAAISYVDTGTSGGDTVSALDTSSNAPSGAGSNNPASASVLYGSSGCQTSCGGTGKKEAPAITASQKRVSGHRSKIKLTVTSHPKLVQATVVFYQVSKNGTRHKIGTAVTDRHGKARGTLKAANGLHLRFQAKVKGRAGVKSGYTKVLKIHVGS